MADRTIRTILQADVTSLQRGMRQASTDAKNTAGDLDAVEAAAKKLDSVTTKIKIKDDQITDTQNAIKATETYLDTLGRAKATPWVEAETDEAKDDLERLTKQLQKLDGERAELEATADIQQATRGFDEVEAARKDTDGKKATIHALVDAGSVDSGLRKVQDAAESVGTDAGKSLGENLLQALVAIPIAGAVIGIGVAIAAGIWQGIEQGLSVEQGRDVFSARTGLDETTAARFGRAAGEAYAAAWGESVSANLETARVALEQGLIDEDATQAEITTVISALSGVTEIMQADIPAAARAAGQMLKTGLVDDASQAFDVLIAGYQNGANASDDLLDTFEEYPTHFRDLGLSAEDAMGLLVQGLEGGAFNADKVADSLKELTIRVKENSDESSAALERIGLDGEDMAERFAAGGDRAREGLDMILDGLRSVEDPAERSQLAVALFGTQAEDMAQALNSLDLSTAADEIGGIEGAAGAAERALATMSDNTSTQIESAKRNVETAAQGIQGALAAAFGDEIQQWAEYVQSHRGEIMEFLSGVANGAFDAAGGFLSLSAAALSGMGEIIGAAGNVVLAIDRMTPGDQHGRAFDEWAQGAKESLQETADTMTGEWTDALDETQDKFNEWAGPEIMSAHIHDAVQAGTARLDELVDAIDSAEGTITINGETVDAETAWQTVVDNIDESTGTVEINGETVTAEDALDTLLGLVDDGVGEITVTGDTSSGAQKANELQQAINGKSASIKVYAEDRTQSAIRSIIASIPTSATIGVGVRRTGFHAGGTVPGLAAGGFVPGSDPGYDNILWPLNAGGTTLMQPLEGGEFVVNSRDASYWAPVLALMNAGWRGQSASSVASRVVQVPVPTQLTVVDADGRLIGTMRTIATETASEWVSA